MSLLKTSVLLRIICSVTVFAIASQSPAQWSAAKLLDFTKRRPTDDPFRMVIAHRGSTYSDAPENSVSAINAAILDGVEAVELDIRVSKDGTPFLFHDSNLARMTGNGDTTTKVWDLPWSQIASLHLCPSHGVSGVSSSCQTGELIPSLVTALQQVMLYEQGWDGLIFLDIRSGYEAQAVWKAIYEAGPDIFSFAAAHVVYKLTAADTPSSDTPYQAGLYSDAQSLFGLLASGTPFISAGYVQNYLNFQTRYFTSTPVSRFASRPYIFHYLNFWYGYTDGIEVNYKSPHGTLNADLANDDLFGYAKLLGGVVAMYNPTGDCTSNPDKSATPGKGTGVWQDQDVCGPITPPVNPDEAPDGIDHRPELVDFALSNGFSSITTDDYRAAMGLIYQYYPNGGRASYGLLNINPPYPNRFSVLCANYGGSCAFGQFDPGTRFSVVLSTDKGKARKAVMVARAGQTDVLCTAEALGVIDPDKDSLKRCWLPNPAPQGYQATPPDPASYPPGFTFCAYDSDTCTVSGPSVIAYGAGQNYLYRSAANSVLCSSSIFGNDPNPNTSEACYVRAATDGEVLPVDVTYAGLSEGMIQVYATPPNSNENINYCISANDNSIAPLCFTQLGTSSATIKLPFGYTQTTPTAYTLTAQGQIGSALGPVSTVPIVSFPDQASGLIPVANNSFEGPVTGWYSSSIDGWDGNGDFGVMTGPYFSQVPDGAQVAYSNGGMIEQRLGATLQAGQTYSLAVDVGQRSDGYKTSSVLQLIAGSKVVADLNLSSPNSGAWITEYLTYTAPVSDSNIGQPLTIRLLSFGSQANWDNVRLAGPAAGSGAPLPVTVKYAGLSGGMAQVIATTPSANENIIFCLHADDQSVAQKCFSQLGTARGALQVPYGYSQLQAGSYTLAAVGYIGRTLGPITSVHVTSFAAPQASNIVPVVNASFESPATDWYTSSVDGWASNGRYGTISANLIGSSATDGTQAAYSDGGTVSQVLNATLQANTLYSLAVDVGQRNGVAESNGILELVAGGVVIATQPLYPPAPGQWVTEYLTYTSPLSVSQIGQPLEVRLVSYGAQALWDNVILTSVGGGPTQ